MNLFYKPKSGFTPYHFIKQSGKGFTLLELLIVIAILAILAAVTILVLNPAELLKKARDSERISELSTIKTAIGYYLIATSSPSYDGSGNSTCVNGSGSKTIYTHQSGVSALLWQTTVTSGSAAMLTNGTGWIKINFQGLSGGSPLSRIPIDPNPAGPTTGPQTNFYYIFGCNATNGTYEVMGNMESQYYDKGGSGDVESTDGGTVAGLYETGTEFSVLPCPTAGCFSNE